MTNVDHIRATPDVQHAQQNLNIMNDYIGREALEKWLLTEMASLDTEADRQCVIERLRKDIPAADVRPVVLCRNCKYWEISKIEPSFRVCTYVCGATFVRNQDDFCSRGADMRKEVQDNA